MDFSILIGVAIGLGLFLYGMTMMGNGLQKAAGSKMEKIIGMLTNNRLVAVLVGTFVTGIIQSSSATTVMVVGFVNAGMMQLGQAIGIIMGANIGTTVTAQLISFNIEQIAPITIVFGILLQLTSKKSRPKIYGEILIGFGILFVGMTYMKDALSPLRDVPAFREALIYFGQNPVLGIAMGFMMTLMVQSSSASIGILVALASQGLLPLSSALPILYGDNIGTCTTALISSIGASKNARRAAVMHLTFNIIGTLIFSLFLRHPIEWAVTTLDPTNVERQVANAHTLFNLINVVIQFPFATLLVKIAEKVIPITPDELSSRTATKYIDLRMLGTPSIALTNTIKECVHMGETAYDSLTMAMKGLLEKDHDSALNAFALEKTINQLEKEIMEYLIHLSSSNLSAEDRFQADELFNVINDIERIGDHADNIAELAIQVIEKELPFSEDSLAEMHRMYDTVLDSYKTSLEAFEKNSMPLALRVIKLEEKVDLMEKEFRRSHIYRLNHNLCQPESGIVFQDLISNLERISDHAYNIAQVAITGNTEAKA